jgi:6-phosphogluconolactonase (cycloisomerase 2 family)
MPLYASVGAELIQFDLDVATAALTRRGTVTVPANVQYVWPHAARRFLYVASSDSASGMGQAGTKHHVSAFRIDPATGALDPHGQPIPLPYRPIHMSTDIPSNHVLVAFNNPPDVSVYRINADATLGAEVSQPPDIDPGVFPHQVLAMPDNRHVILVARGHDAAGGKPEEPGALKVFRHDNGVLRDEVSIAPNGGYGFGPRHLDFHPTKPWIYVSLERQNALAMFTHDAGRLAATPAYQVNALTEPDNIRGHQLVGTVHVHPNGRFVYVANRASSTVDKDGKKVFAGGENTIAAFAIDQSSGKPALIQHVDTNGIHCRTFHIDPTGKLMVCAHIMGLSLADSSEIPTRLTLFRIGDDGELTFARSYDIETGGRLMWWMGIVNL